MTGLSTAIKIAAEVHEEHTDKADKPYILHPLRVMMRLRTDDEELQTVAILHDVIEDSNISLSQLATAGFSERVIDALQVLTHGKEDSYESYIKKVSTNVDAMIVKMEDLRDNSDITRLKGLSKKDFERMEKYHRAFTFLKNVLASHKIAYANS